MEQGADQATIDIIQGQIMQGMTNLDINLAPFLNASEIFQEIALPMLEEFVDAYLECE